MALTIRHNKVTAIPDDPAYDVGSNEWNDDHAISGTFAAAQMPALTGDVTAPGASLATTLAAVNGNVGSFGLAASVAQFTVNAKGLITAAANVAIAIAAGAVSGLASIATSGSASDLSAGTVAAARMPAFTGDVTTSAGAVATTLATTQTAIHTWSAQQTFTANPFVSMANANILVRDNGTSFAYMDIRGGASGVNGLRFGQEAQSGGNNLVVGSAASDGVVTMRDNTRIIFGANNAAVLYINPSGGIGVVTGTDPGAGAVLANTSIKSQGATHGIGYATGAGGAVTQATNKATGVTLNTITGKITMDAAALNAGVIVSFVLTDSAVAATDAIIATHESGGTPGAYTINARATGAGTAAIDVRNNTAGNLSEAIVIRFAVIKSVNA